MADIRAAISAGTLNEFAAKYYQQQGLKHPLND